ncbi:MAG: phospho-N-acetylmuramoyl-pentapeptide-transferase, partial [Clostridiales bacterium]|nr:phospho-N-acetylmuramoyl-pentapeptide-transferase [Clostridiales bacterium]
MLFVLFGSLLAAFAIMLIVMPKFLPFLKKLKFGQTIYDLGPQAHLAKQGTPNMGGIAIAGATVLVAVTVAMFRCESYGTANRLWPLLFTMLGSMAIGFADDYIKDVKKDHEGLKPKQKLAGQLVLGIIVSVYCYFFVGHDVLLPFTSGKTWDLGIFYIPLMTVLIMFMTNSANLQDGVDGILSTVTMVGMMAFGLIAVKLDDA